MDPNAALAKIREIIANLEDEQIARKINALAELDFFTMAELEILANTVEDLDEWLSKGGFPPADWVGPR